MSDWIGTSNPVSSSGIPTIPAVIKNAQIYCTVQELIQDLKLDGFDPTLGERITAASRTIEREMGLFIPVTDTRKFSGHRRSVLRVDPVLSVSLIMNYDIEVTDYTLLPETPPWANGPYSAIHIHGCWEDTGVEITGSWGKYSEVRSLKINGTIAAGATELVVANGSKLSPGMVLLVENEQILVSAGAGSTDSPAPTAAISTLSAAIIDTDEAIIVTNGAEFFAGETLQIGVEDLFIRKINGNELLVNRGWNQTPADDHAEAAVIKVYRTFLVDRAMNGTVEITHTNVLLSRYVVPEDVNWLCRQIAALMKMKAESGFSGRIGNSEIGEAGYYSEFPPNQIERVKNHYKLWTL